MYARALHLNESDQSASHISVLLKSEQEMNIMPSPVTTVPKSRRLKLAVNKRHPTTRFLSLIRTCHFVIKGAIINTNRVYRKVNGEEHKYYAPLWCHDSILQCVMTR